MKVCFNEATAKECSDLEKDIRLCAAEGFEYIELRLDMIFRYLRSHTVMDIRALLQEHGISPHALNAVYTYPDFFGPQDDEEKSQAFLKEYLSALSIAEKIGSSYMIIVPPMMQASFTTPYDRDEESSVEDFSRIMSRLADLAEGYGISLCIEPVGAPKSSIRSVSTARRVLEAISKENVGLVLDAYNLYMNRQDNDFSEILQLDGKKIFAVHMNNADSCELSQANRRFCDGGIVDLSKFLLPIKEKGYQGIASIETFRPEYWMRPAEEVIHEAYVTTRKCLEENGCLS